MFDDPNTLPEGGGPCWADNNYDSIQSVVGLDGSAERERHLSVVALSLSMYKFGRQTASSVSVRPIRR